MSMAGHLTWAVSSVREAVNTLLHCEDDDVTRGLLDVALLKSELAYRELLAQDIVVGLTANQQLACEQIRVAMIELYKIRDRGCTTPNYVPPVTENGHVGRPKFDFPREQLEVLIENHFTVPQMASMLGVSVSTVRRRMSEYNLTIRSCYTQLTDHELDRIVQEIHHNFPTCGNRQLQGYLLARGLRVQQHRIRDAHRHVDPEGSVMRRLQAMHRRSYCVPAPRSLYHIDGNHKLIR